MVPETADDPDRSRVGMDEWVSFRTFIGASEDVAATAYLCPETRQSVLTDFKRVREAARRMLA